MTENLQLIRKYQSFMGCHLGPYCFASEFENKIASVWHPIVENCINQIKRSETNGMLDLSAPTAEHAAVFLKAIQIEAGYGTHRNDPKSWGAGPLIFRGVRDQSWSIVSSQYRASESGYNQHHAKDAFMRIVQAVGNRALQTELPIELYECVAQHYGYPTNLIDITPDPEVAVFFSTLSGGDSKACIYFTNVRNLLKRNLEVKLPPPLFERIYLQRGAFIQSDGEIEKELFHKISFPSDTPIPIFRGGYPVDILRSPRWIEHAKQFVERSEMVGEIEGIYDRWFDSDKDFHFSPYAPQHDAMTEFPKWLDSYEDMRYWLACSMKDDKELFWDDILSAIETANKHLVELHKKLMQLLRKPY